MPELMQNYILHQIGSGGNASMITKDVYGKTVTNYTKGGQTWEILYADGNNIYLITHNRVTDPVYNSLNLKSVTDAGTYSAGANMLSDTARFLAASKWFSGWLNSRYASGNNANPNMQATLFMLDITGVWNNTFRDERYADYAIGGPTLELLCASYNKAKGTSLAAELSNSYGYPQTIRSGLDMGTVWNHSQHYWLACPCGDGAGHQRFVSYNNAYVGTNSYSTGNIGFRPVVCLKSSVCLEASEDGNSYAIK